MNQLPEAPVKAPSHYTTAYTPSQWAWLRGGGYSEGRGGGGTVLAVKPKAQPQGRVWLPVTLAVQCYIIYADMNLMEHMCAPKHASVCVCTR